MKKTALITSLAAALIAAALILTLPSHLPGRPPAFRALDGSTGAFDGRDTQIERSQRPTVEIAFPRESYAPGQVAKLRVFSTARDVSLDVVHAGLENRSIAANDLLDGRAVTPARRLGTVRAGDTIAVPIGGWPSGLYFARLTGPNHLTGYATFVLRPKALGEHRVAVVLPTQTWQAYNYRDDDRDGIGDSWYVNSRRTTAHLFRPIFNRGVPPHYKYYDQPFLRWLHQSGKDVDFLSDTELNTVASGKVLARAYDLIVFEGHHEYVTAHEYDVVTQFRDLGGNLAFLSANNFFYKITRQGDVMTRVGTWRQLGRPEAALIGVQFYRNDEGEHRGPWRVASTSAAPWLFEGTDIRAGVALGSGGIEADEVTPASPRGVRVIARIENLFGDGHDAEMTYYRTAAGAKVFAAGAFTFAGEAQWPQIKPLLQNLWNQLARP